MHTRRACAVSLVCPLIPAVAHSSTARQRARPIMMSATKGSASAQDLLIVGPGVLGSCLGVRWKEAHPESRVVGQTNTTTSHDRLQALGLDVRTNDQADDSKFPFVAFTAPPSGSDDYPASVARAVALWDGTGAMVFTSSAGVYAVQSGECTEDSPLAEMGSSARTDKLRKAEQAALDAGGTVLRCVGLYHSNRGAHTFFLKKGELDRSGEAIINLIHYEDAAGLAQAILEGQGGDEYYRGQTFLGCDNNPVTFREMMDVATSSGVYEGQVKFTGEGGGGKTVNNSATRQRLQWQPKFDSFKAFVQNAEGKDFYSS